MEGKFFHPPGLHLTDCQSVVTMEATVLWSAQHALYPSLYYRPSSLTSALFLKFKFKINKIRYTWFVT